MEVDLTFDLDATRYRIVRSYQQSASGKTSKPGLEVQVLDPDTDGYTPLTAESVRATQAVIDARIGIDYETFINSTFLLQGRSDEFTKKKPASGRRSWARSWAWGATSGWRARRATRWSGLREQANALEAEAERLTAALGPVERAGRPSAKRSQICRQDSNAKRSPTATTAGGKRLLASRWLRPRCRTARGRRSARGPRRPRRPDRRDSAAEAERVARATQKADATHRSGRRKSKPTTHGTRCSVRERSALRRQGDVVPGHRDAAAPSLSLDAERRKTAEAERRDRVSLGGHRSTPLDATDRGGRRSAVAASA